MGVRRYGGRVPVVHKPSLRLAGVFSIQPVAAHHNSSLKCIAHRREDLGGFSYSLLTCCWKNTIVLVDL
jgi:hypothetical protein